MSNFLQRFRRERKGRSEDNSKSPSGRAELGAVYSKREKTPEQQALERESSLGPESPGPAVEISDSIFAGLQLSGPVRRKEGVESPYLKRASDVLTISEPEAVEEESPFPFLGNSGDNTLESHNESHTADTIQDEPQRSPFAFIQQEESQSDAKDEHDGTKSEGESSSSFSFLNDPPVTKDRMSSNVTSKEPSSPTLQQSTEDRQSVPSEPYSPNASLRKGSGTPTPIPAVVFNTTSPPPRAQHVGKQQPPSGTKKKRRALRPGQARTDDSSAGLSLESAPQRSSARDPDSLSVSSQASSLDGGKESVSMSSSSSELHKLAAEETHKAKEETGEQVNRQTETHGEEEEGRKCSTNQNPVETKPSDLGGGGDSGIGQVNTSHSQPERISEGENSKRGDLLHEEGVVAMTAVEEQPEAGESEGAGRSLTAVKNGSEPSETQLLAEVFASGSKPPANYEVELLPSDKLTALLQSCDSNLGKILCSLSEVQKDQKGKVEGHLSQARQQIERRAHVNELRAKEAKALSEEDYDLAEELSQELEALSLESEWTIADNCLVTLQEWMQRCAELMESEVVVQQDIQRQLVEMKGEQEKALTEMDKELSSAQTKQKMRLKTLEDKIERERGHIALDREHLEKREQLLQEEIEQRAAVFIANKEELQENLASIDSEISALEAKLLSLRERRSGILSSISEEERRIGSIHEELSSENGQLAEERRQIERKEEQLQGEVDHLSEQRKDSEAILGQQEAQRLAVMSRLEELGRREATIDTRMITLRQSLGQSEALLPLAKEGSTTLKPSDKLQSLQDAHRSKDNHVHDLTSQVLSLQSKLASHRKKIADTESQLPQMQEAKKAVVAARQYKEAARLASEIKALDSTLESEKENVKKTESALAVASEELSTVSRELSAIKEELSSVEEEEDVAHIKALVQSVGMLKSRMESIPGADSPFQEVLQRWCDMYQLLAENLCTKQGLKFTDFTPEEPAKREDSATPHATQPDSDRSDQLEAAPPPEERTPGVGMELESLSDTTPCDVEEEGKTEEVRGRMAQLEAQIEEACVKEDYDLAAELDEQLQKLKKVLSESTD